MDGRDLLPLLHMLCDRYESASEARRDLSDRLAALNHRRRAAETVTEASLTVGSPPHETDDIEGAHAVVYRSARGWSDRTQAMEWIVGALVMQVHEESRFSPSTYDTAPLPSAVPPTPDTSTKARPSEPTRGGWSAPRTI